MFPIATLTLLRQGGGVFIPRVGFRAGVLAGVLPPLFSSGAPGNLLGGVICLGLLGSAGVIGSLDGKDGLALAFPVATLTLLRRGGSVFVGRISFRAGVFAGVLPPLFSSSASIGQNIKSGHILNLVHCQLFAHIAVAHVLMERADHDGGMNVGDIVLHLAEPLDVLAQGFPFLLGNDVQITGLAMSLVASCEGANEFMA